MKRIKIQCSLLASSLLLATSAFAYISTPYGWYLEANLGASKLFGNNTNSNGSNTTGLGGSLNLGYKFMPYFAGEIGVTRYANSTIKTPGGTQAGTQQFYSYYITSKGILPVYDTGFEIFAKLGIMRARSSINISNSAAANSMGLSRSSHSSTGIYLGAGGQYYFMPEFAVVGQWARAQANNSSGGALDLYSIGLSFIFD